MVQIFLSILKPFTSQFNFSKTGSREAANSFGDITLAHSFIQFEGFAVLVHSYKGSAVVVDVAESVSVYGINTLSF